MEDVLPTKPNLPPDYLECAVGEPYVVRQALLDNFDINYSLPKVDDLWNYPSPGGYAPLVKLLEDKYQAPVVMTNGAKQGLSACMYAISKLGYVKLAVKKPYWCLIPALADLNGLKLHHEEVDEIGLPYLLVAPNNPDGFIPDNNQMQKICEEITDDK